MLVSSYSANRIGSETYLRIALDEGCEQRDYLNRFPESHLVSQNDVLLLVEIV